jgi:hypothetical protein
VTQALTLSEYRRPRYSRHLLLLLADKLPSRRFITDSQAAQNRVLSQQDTAYAGAGNLSNGTKGEKPLLSDNGEALSEHAAMGGQVRGGELTMDNNGRQRLQDLSE